jgi:NADH dehydrogenase (ubiquinone) 1 alpha subcomplex subunit 6
MKKAPTLVSRNFDEARRNALRLYRQCLRAIPSVIRQYKLELRPHQIKNSLRQLFIQNKNIREPAIIDILVFKGQMELEETVNLWKTRAHVLHLLKTKSEAEQNPRIKEILDKTTIPLSAEKYRRRQLSSSSFSSSSPSPSPSTSSTTSSSTSSSSFSSSSPSSSTPQ